MDTLRPKHYQVLIVDDEPGIRSFVRYYATIRGADATTACNGMEALHLLEREEFDIVITDIHMPGMNGDELVRRVFSRAPCTHFVLMSGTYDGYSLPKEVGHQFLPKPFTVVELGTVWEKALRDLASRAPGEGRRGAEAEREMRHEKGGANATILRDPVGVSL